MATGLSNADGPEQVISSVLESIIDELAGSAVFLAPIEEGEYVVRYLREAMSEAIDGSKRSATFL